CAAYLPGPTRNREGEGKRRIDPEERDEAPTGSRTRGSTSSTRRTRFGSRPVRRCPPARRVGVPEARRAWGGSWGNWARVRGWASLFRTSQSRPGRNRASSLKTLGRRSRRVRVVRPREERPTAAARSRRPGQQLPVEALGEGNRGPICPEGRHDAAGEER